MDLINIVIREFALVIFDSVHHLKKTFQSFILLLNFLSKLCLLNSRIFPKLFHGES